MKELIFQVTRPLIDVDDIQSLPVGIEIASISSPNAFRISLETYRRSEIGKMEIAAFAYTSVWEHSVAQTSPFLDIGQPNSHELFDLLEQAMVSFLSCHAISFPDTPDPRTSEPSDYYVGNLVITSPVHVFGDAYKGNLHKWVLGCPSEAPQSLGISHFDAGKTTGCRIASFTVLDNLHQRPLGRFYSERGEVGIFLMDEIDMANPSFRDWLADNPDQAVVLPNFAGYAYLAQTRTSWGERATSVIGIGNKNFRSILTSRAERSIAV